MRIANYFYPCLGLLTILRYSIQGLGYSNLSILSGVMEMIARCGVSLWLVIVLYHQQPHSYNNNLDSKLNHLHLYLIQYMKYHS